MKRPTHLALLAALLLTGCSTAQPVRSTRSQPVQPSYVADATFQFGQNLTIKLDPATGNSGLQQAFAGWVEQGVYTNTPVYRQLPGVFVLTGKPRLAGGTFIEGSSPTRTKPDQREFPEASVGQVGLVTHADGTVGPELIFIYGYSVTACCEAPQNVRIGKIVKGRSSLKSVQRGDNLQSIAIQP
ncbi:MAG: hypothetical protein EOP85_03700 [Verrucomicrobiaceae bacterium]|nr:MAG: hypothetical protein EOP85_03700 [Verrucomicrobiaceae bacterium]